MNEMKPNTKRKKYTFVIFLNIFWFEDGVVLLKTLF